MNPTAQIEYRWSHYSDGSPQWCATNGRVFIFVKQNHPLWVKLRTPLFFGGTAEFEVEALTEQECWEKIEEQIAELLRLHACINAGLDGVRYAA